MSLVLNRPDNGYRKNIIRPVPGIMVADPAITGRGEVWRYSALVTPSAFYARIPASLLSDKRHTFGHAVAIGGIGLRAVIYPARHDFLRYPDERLCGVGK